MADVRVETRGQALWLTIDREDKRNALDDAVLHALREGVEAAGQRDDIRAVVITGAGSKVFCAGGNLKQDAEGDPFRVDPNRLDNPVAVLLRAIEDCPVATIARVNGAWSAPVISPLPPTTPGSARPRSRSACFR